jgi:DNA-binding GntR family transcriptional regulator
VSSDAPSSTEPLAVEAYRELKRRILETELAPGQVIYEKELSDELRVSRTPIREAFWMLQAERLVVMRPRRGAQVASVSRQDLIEAYAVREWLEPPLAALAACAASDGEALRRLGQLLDEYTENPRTHAEVVAAETADIRFHDAIMELAGNALARSFVQQARMVTQRIAHFVPHGRYPQSRQEHLGIYEAIAERDAERAQEQMQAHIATASRRIQVGS